MTEDSGKSPKEGVQEQHTGEGFSQSSQLPITGKKGTRSEAQLTFLPFLNESRLNISGQEGKLES